MELKEILSYEELKKYLVTGKNIFLLLYKAGSEKSECAYNNLKTAAGRLEKDVQILTADVSKVKDIHHRYQIKTAPSLLEFENDLFKRSVKGCQTADYYTSFINNTLFVSHHDDQSAQKRVVVYSTPSCPHCNNLKNYLRRNQIHYRDIDVSKDQKMAQELVRKSGQQGVPQTEIDGRIIVGFNKQKIDQMLGLQA
jgi:glutaredoxin-like YruB-family protein